MQSIIIGNQEWTCVNISEIVFSNGDLIPVAYDLKEWLDYFESSKPCCILDEWSGSESPFYFYNGFAVSDMRGIGQNGFRIPSQKDYLKLLNGLDIENGCPELRWSKGCEAMLDFQGTNTMGFNGKFTGHIDFEYDDNQSFLWTSEETMFMDGYNEITASIYFTWSNFWYDSNRLGLPIRLVRDL